ncbi:hypothetical protein V496_02917 [Pseudogymnoascus sp. VKM F-4515 (FW-2607)]|nr:hypothetical protein V496_02917 [Pseudogymnoascus sp. VKM F-4515 (FW-2607)]
MGSSQAGNGTTIGAVAEGDSLPNHFYGRLLRKTLAYATRTKGQLQAALWGSEFWSNSRLAGRSRWSIEITTLPIYGRLPIGPEVVSSPMKADFPEKLASSYQSQRSPGRAPKSQPVAIWCNSEVAARAVPPSIPQALQTDDGNPEGIAVRDAESPPHQSTSPSPPLAPSVGEDRDPGFDTRQSVPEEEEQIGSSEALAKADTAPREDSPVKEFGVRRRGRVWKAARPEAVGDKGHGAEIDMSLKSSVKFWRRLSGDVLANNPHRHRPTPLSNWCLRRSEIPTDRRCEDVSMLGSSMRPIRPPQHPRYSGSEAADRLIRRRYADRLEKATTFSTPAVGDTGIGAISSIFPATTRPLWQSSTIPCPTGQVTLGKAWICGAAGVNSYSPRLLRKQKETAIITVDFRLAFAAGPKTARLRGQNLDAPNPRLGGGTAGKNSDWKEAERGIYIAPRAQPPVFLSASGLPRQEVNDTSTGWSSCPSIEPVGLALTKVKVIAPSDSTATTARCVRRQHRTQKEILMFWSSLLLCPGGNDPAARRAMVLMKPSAFSSSTFFLGYAVGSGIQ